ncbi:MAG: hypothetical protein ABW224_10515 [Kibdelosporangium sp.]
MSKRILCAVGLLVALMAGAPAATAAPVDVRGGYYLGGNGDVTAHAGTIGNVEALTQYRSLADGNTFPGWQKAWIDALGPAVTRNFVLELKSYGGPAGAQAFTVDGVRYAVPAPNMTIQQRPGTTWPKAYGYDQVTGGQIDGLLHRSLAQIKTMQHNTTLTIQLASEFDTDHEFGTTENGVTRTWAQSDERAVAAVRYMVKWFKEHGLPQGVKFSVGIGGFNRDAFKRMHPAALAPEIDVLQWNAYNHGSNRTSYEVFNRTKAWAVADLPAAWLTKPVYIAEWGTAASLGDQATWIRTVPAALARMNSEAGPSIVVANYFNSNPAWATLTPTEKGLSGLRDAYASAPFK